MPRPPAPKNIILTLYLLVVGGRGTETLVLLIFPFSLKTPSYRIFHFSFFPFIVILSLRNVLKAILQSMLLFLKRRHYKHGLLVGVVMVAVVMVAGFKRVGKQALLKGV